MSYKRAPRLGPCGASLGAGVKKTYQPGEEGFPLLDRIIDRLRALLQTVFEFSGPEGVPLGQDPTLRAGYEYFLMTSPQQKLLMTASKQELLKEVT